MFWRALIALLALPGMFAGLIPALIIRSDSSPRFQATPLGYVLIAIGIALLFWCVRDFFVIGKGTLAPWDPPKKLVIVGLYRWTRNPIYVAVIVLLTGWLSVTGSRFLAFYMLVLALAFHLRVILHEEPSLRRKFPDDWRNYSTAVRRWLPRLPSKARLRVNT